MDKTIGQTGVPDVGGEDRCQDELVSLRDHLTAMLREMDMRYTEKFRYYDIAINKAEASMDRRFESVNEFRSMINDVLGTMMPRVESDHRYTALNDKVEAIVVEFEKRQATGVGIQKSWSLLAGILGVIAMAVSTFALLLTHLFKS